MKEKKKDYRILLVEDDEEDYIIVHDLLNEIPNTAYELHWVESLAKGREEMQANHYDAYLIDYLLGNDNGLELIKEANSNQELNSPILLLTGQGSLEVDKEAMEAGASDYLVKNLLTPLILDRAIRYNIRHIQNLKQIQELNQTLESKVEERTKELAESLEKEKHLSEMKSRFVSMASHEFRTPLSTILSSVSLIEKHNQKHHQNENITKHVHRIQGSINNLTEILNDFLSIEKLEEGAIQTHLTSFDMQALADKIREDMQEVTKDGQKINYCHTGTNTIIHSDKQLLRNIIINLLSNAIKYSFEDSTIDFQTCMQDGEGLQLTITDQGIGIPKEEQKNMFTRFFRAKNALYHQGTGLGMNIVKKYVDLLNGNIEISSEENQGTSIKVHIPQNKINYDKDTTH